MIKDPTNAYKLGELEKHTLDFAAVLLDREQMVEDEHLGKIIPRDAWTRQDLERLAKGKKTKTLTIVRQNKDSKGVMEAELMGFLIYGVSREILVIEMMAVKDGDEEIVAKLIRPVLNIARDALPPLKVETSFHYENKLIPILLDMGFQEEYTSTETTKILIKRFEKEETLC
jgi:hypothetical protein